MALGKRITRISVLTVTGTRKGGTPQQASTFIKLMNEYRPEVVCNGCCRGWDQDCLKILVHMKLPIRIECWPSSVEQRDEARTILKDYRPVFYHPIFAARRRNQLMLDIPADLLIAVPSGEAEEGTGSGTWDTVRIAAKLKVRTVVIWPSGAAHAGFKPAHAVR